MRFGVGLCAFEDSDLALLYFYSEFFLHSLIYLEPYMRFVSDWCLIRASTYHPTFAGIPRLRQ